MHALLQVLGEAVDNGYSPCPHGMPLALPQPPDTVTCFPGPEAICICHCVRVRSRAQLVCGLVQGLDHFRRELASGWGKRLKNNPMKTGQDLSVRREFPICSLLVNTTWNLQARAGNRVFLICSSGLGCLLGCGRRVDSALTGSEDGSWV